MTFIIDIFFEAPRPKGSHSECEQRRANFLRNHCLGWFGDPPRMLCWHIGGPTPFFFVE